MSFIVKAQAPRLEEAVRLLRQTSWTKTRPEEMIATSLEHSYCVAAFSSTGEAVAMARVVTDYATYAYLCDVVVDEAHRGQGIGKAMMGFIMELDFVQSLRRFSLITADAHELYRPFGFAEMDRPSRYMEIFKGD
jgi:GNAT superfamily N-acetyltransferase